MTTAFVDANVLSVFDTAPESVFRLNKFLETHDVHLTVTVDVLYEGFRIRDESVRANRFQTIHSLRTNFDPQPWGYLVAREIVEVVRSVWPAYLHHRPDHWTRAGLLNQYEEDWSLTRDRPGMLPDNYSDSIMSEAVGYMKVTHRWYRNNPILNRYAESTSANQLNGTLQFTDDNHCARLAWCASLRRVGLCEGLAPLLNRDWHVSSRQRDLNEHFL